MKDYRIGLDIGGTKCAVLLARVSESIQLVDKIRFDTQTERGFEDTWGRLTAAMDELLQKHADIKSRVASIGISCGGPLDSRRGIILCPPNLPGWVNIPAVELLQQRFGLPAYLQNDANACALVEWQLGAGRGTQDMVFLTMGTGMGAGIISGGRLLVGHTDMGGEVGHLRLRQSGPVGFGKAGSFEGFTSGGGIALQARALTQQLLAEGKTPAWVRDGVPLQQLSCKVMADYARKGDTDALALFESIGTHLGEGIALITDTVNPQAVVIGSIFARCEDLLRPSMEAALQKEAIPFGLQGMQVLPAQTGESIGDLASIMVALYGEGTALPAAGPEKQGVTSAFEELFVRYPALEACRQDIWQAYRVLRGCYLQGGKLLTCGNGGSCADSEHIVGELMKGFKLKRPLDKETAERISAAAGDMLADAGEKLQAALPAICLTSHSALATAWANDCDPALCFAQQVLGYGRKGDVLLGISTSGNSRNVALTCATARAQGLCTIGLTGQDGGRLKQLCDVCIRVPSAVTAEVQEYHLPVYHTLCAMLEEAFFA